MLYKRGPCLQTCKQTALKHLHSKCCTSVAEPVDTFFFILKSSDRSNSLHRSCSPSYICHVVASKLHRGQTLFPACAMPISRCIRDAYCSCIMLVCDDGYCHVVTMGLWPVELIIGQLERCRVHAC